MRSEAILAPIPPETKPQNKAKTSLNPNFLGPQWARLERDKIIPVASGVGFSSVILLENISVQKVNKAEFIKMAVVKISTVEEVKKSLAYNPGKRSKEYVDETGRRIVRRKRPSRCNGSHDVEADPCGSPRCRSTNGKDNMKANNSTRRTKRQRRQRVIMNPRKVRK